MNAGTSRNGKNTHRESWTFQFFILYYRLLQRTSISNFLCAASSTVPLADVSQSMITRVSYETMDVFFKKNRLLKVKLFLPNAVKQRMALFCLLHWLEKVFFLILFVLTSFLPTNFRLSFFFCFTQPPSELGSSGKLKRPEPAALLE